MGYYLQGIISNELVANKFLDKYSETKKIKLLNDIFLIPLSEELIFEINDSEDFIQYGNFTYLTENITKYFEKLSEFGTIIYIEAEYFGGTGAQLAAYWENKKLISIFNYDKNSINQALSKFGIKKEKNKDEFDTINLVRIGNPHAVHVVM